MIGHSYLKRNNRIVCVLFTLQEEQLACHRGYAVEGGSCARTGNGWINKLYCEYYHVCFHLVGLPKDSFIVTALNTEQRKLRNRGMSV